VLSNLTDLTLFLGLLGTVLYGVLLDYWMNHKPDTLVAFLSAVSEQTSIRKNDLSKIMKTYKVEAPTATSGLAINLI
jgi:hypothetical protein